MPGTIVSVLQAAAGAAEDAGADGADLADGRRRRRPTRPSSHWRRRPQQLDVLAEAGVVDAGGRGLLVLLDALTATLTGHAPHRRLRAPAVAAAVPVGRPDRGAPPQFEVMYLLERLRPRGRRDASRAPRAARRIGDHRRVGRRRGRYSVHVHADDAGGSRRGGLDVGTPSRIQITALTGAAGARPPGGWTRDRAVLAIVDGDGAAALFAGEGAHVLRPDADAPISAQHLLRALVDAGAAQIMVLPNGYVAAEELVAGCTAAIGWGIDVVPVPAGSMVQGLAALAVHDAGRQAVDDGYTMARAAAGARHGSVRVADRGGADVGGHLQAGRRTRHRR